MSSGEALPADLAATMAGAVGGRVLNMYGPTETTVWSTTRCCRSVESEDWPAIARR